MKRIHLFEFTDLKWYPRLFRQMQTDYLQFAANFGEGHTHIVPLIIKAMQSVDTHEVVDLCSGGAGPWRKLTKQLSDAGWPVNVKLTDKYPSKSWVEKNKEFIGLQMEYLAESIDATCVPPALNGMRTIFEGFHHFKPDQAKAILADAAIQRVPIGVFDASFKSPYKLLLLVLSPIITFLTYLIITPMMKPRHLSRFVFTYLIPIVPLATCWDGVVSMLRVYSASELRALTDQINAKDYVWETGDASTGTPIFTFTYLIGYPKK